MNSEITIRQNIENALKNFDNQPLREAATTLLNTLGYYSKRVGNDAIDSNRFDRLVDSALDTAKPSDKLRIEEWQSFFQIMQVADEEINQQVDPEQGSLFESTQIDDALRTSYMFVTVQLTKNTYTRTQLADITRFINKAFEKSIMVMFRYGAVLSLAIINRRHHERNPNKQVLEKVTLIKDINLDSPKRAHIDILSELHLRSLIEIEDVTNFDTLHKAWEGILNTEALNKQFYRKLFAWYEWTVETATFPTDENRTLEPEEYVIRLITRLLFIWFIKEKGLVADELFSKTQIQDLLNENDFNNGDSYYRAVLQNLFFATLNTEIDKRRFSTQTRKDHRNFSVYRYESQMEDSDRLLELFAKTPFINGGLFDCLDTFTETGGGGYRIDCFSDKQYHKLSIPNRLFFDEEQGLIPLLEHYKFTVEENTPIDQEVALDPELLGRVFEHLLAEYNPETREIAKSKREETGTYYTPRVIVDYMVEESLIATLSQKCQPNVDNEIPWDERLRYLFDYAKIFDDASEWFDDSETDDIVKAISELKILDPAVGSGAFPMGVLHKLTLALRRLDPDNTRWEALQRDLAGERAKETFASKDDQERPEELTEIDNTFKRYRDSDFGRKLYLIQNSIFGVDIQPIACQIAKLRFFISLAIEQKPDSGAENYGIKPLPNLETRFVAADTLIGLKIQMSLKSQKAVNLEQELRNNRENHFHATTRQQKRTCKDRDDELRAKLATELKQHEAFADEADNIAKWNPYDQNEKADWFDPELMFGVTDGFDVVIGNPPYIQLQKDNSKLGRMYAPCKFDTFIRTGDIYCLFYEKGHQLLKCEGNLCFITSNKWMRTAYGEKLRDYFIQHTQPIQLLDTGPDVFDATVDTNIILLQNILQGDLTDFKAVKFGAEFDKQTDSISKYLNDNSVTMQKPAKGQVWSILSPLEFNVKRKIEAVGKPLKDWNINIYRGIVTGCNEAFIIDDAKREQLIAQDPKSVEIIKPLLRGKDIECYHTQAAKSYILATGYDIDISKKYSVIYKYLETIGKQIESGEIKTRGKGLFERDDQGKNWWNLRACDYYSEFEKEKVVWKRIGSILRFAYIERPMFCLDSTCIATGKNVKLLTAVLNSPVSHFQLFSLAPTTGTGDLIVSVQAIEPILVPPVTEANQSLVTKIENKVDKIIAAKVSNSKAKTKKLEGEIDKLVYCLYDLTEEEIAIVEGNV